jgi:hypothetical protein
MEKMRAAGMVAAKAAEDARIPDIPVEEKSAEEEDFRIISIDGAPDGTEGGDGTTESA